MCGILQEFVERPEWLPELSEFDQWSLVEVRSSAGSVKGYALFAVLTPAGAD